MTDNRADPVWHIMPDNDMPIRKPILKFITRSTSQIGHGKSPDSWDRELKPATLHT
ncbi:hypothetical protein H5A18_14880 [Pectobacterium brasiliense]|uniref:hypothetical protein n=1 Tax=Pectobacterium brasiliense TaxID=180957 RepID=UPI0015E288F2|nr:hypothetical protein [Pectobacterium brasiliense]MBN3183187.1 hypothetical protein [Pectobacterium brasiliense]